MFSPLFWLFDLCFRGITVNLFRHQLLHLVGYVGICVQGSSAGYITQNCRQGLDVHSVGLGVGCKSMARTMKSHPFTSRIIQNSVQALMGRGWTHGQVFFLWGWKHPSWIHLGLILCQHSPDGWRQNHGTNRRFCFGFTDDYLWSDNASLLVDPQLSSR